MFSRRSLFWLIFWWFFLMEVNTDGTTFGFNVFMWRPALTFTSVIFITWSKSYSPALRNVLILLYRNLYSTDFGSFFGNLKKTLFVFCQFLWYYTFLHTQIQQYFPFPFILSCFGRSSTVFWIYFGFQYRGFLTFIW